MLNTFVNDTKIPVVSTLLGHSEVVTVSYLKIDLFNHFLENNVVQ